MPDIRRLKKEVKGLASELIAECETYKVFHPDIPAEAVNQVAAEINALMKSIIYEINHFKKSGETDASRFFKEKINRVHREMIPLLDKLADIRIK